MKKNLPQGLKPEFSGGWLWHDSSRAPSKSQLLLSGASRMGGKKQKGAASIVQKSGVDGG
jgi:hypothetical protein